MKELTTLTAAQGAADACVGLPQPDARTTESLHRQWKDKCAEFADTARIAIIDDEEMNIEVVQGHLEQAGYKNFFRTTDSTQALDLIDSAKPDLVLLDIMMPEVSGLEILAAMRADEQMRYIPVVILTASTSAVVKLRALELESSDFLEKPVDSSELQLCIRNVLAIKSYQDHLANYSLELERMVEKRTEELFASRQRIIHCLARAAEFRDDDTGHHVIRVGKYAAVIADQLGFDRYAVGLIEQAAKLHDVGKIGVPDSVLLKQGKLEPEEFELIKNHCRYGYSIIEPNSSNDIYAYQKKNEAGVDLLTDDSYPVMDLAAIIAQSHHEKWDGSGYPNGLAGADIPIEGRITAVADVFDALSSKRPYKPAFPIDKCFEILEEGRGTHFDPQILDAFFVRREEIVGIQSFYAEP